MARAESPNRRPGPVSYTADSASFSLGRRAGLGFCFEAKLVLDFGVVGIDHVVVALVGLLLTGTARLLLGACLSLLSLSSLLVELFTDLLGGSHQRFNALFDCSLSLIHISEPTRH